MVQIAIGFDALLGAHTPADLERESGSVVGLWPDGRIALLNGAWRRFAQQNQGADTLHRWPLGADMLSAISGVLLDYYKRAFAGVRAQRRPWEQTYQCHSALSMRQFRLRVLPLENDALLLIHSVVVDAPFSSTSTSTSTEARSAAELGSHASDAEELDAYVGPSGLVRQCSNCRRTQHVTREGWDWVRAYVTHPPRNVSHGICTTCLRQDYPDLR